MLFIFDLANENLAIFRLILTGMGLELTIFTIDTRILRVKTAHIRQLNDLRLVNLDSVNDVVL